MERGECSAKVGERAPGPSLLSFSAILEIGYETWARVLGSRPSVCLNLPENKGLQTYPQPSERASMHGRGSGPRFPSPLSPLS